MLAVAAGEEEHAPVLLLLGVQDVVAAIGVWLITQFRATISNNEKEGGGGSSGKEGGTYHSRQNFMALMAAAAVGQVGGSCFRLGAWVYLYTDER